jgi:acetyl-CoA decarbonylase/synthase complex subunit gamma
MPLTALDIYKHLPKTNCGDCGVPTCLAFAMKLAGKQAQLTDCPHISQQAKETLESSAQPPMRLVTIGAGEKAIQIGNETELFRHEKRFYHETAYCVPIDDDLDESQISARLQTLKTLEFERVGKMLGPDLVAIRSKSGDPKRFVEAVKVVRGATQLPLVLMSDDPAVIEAGLQVTLDSKPLIYRATSSNFDAMSKLAKDKGLPLVVFGEGLDQVVELSEKAKAAGLQDVVLDADFGSAQLHDMLRDLTTIRRMAIKKNFRPLGFPTLVTMKGGSDEDMLRAALATMKYASIVITDGVAPYQMFPLVTLRQNIYTDPQKPIQVKPGIYEINGPTEKSPLLVTTNFSLTYFIVSGDVDSSKIPSHLMVVDSEGLSVMTAFAADKFNADLVVKFLDELKAKEKVTHNTIVIPGIVSMMSGKLKEKSGWDVIVGPRDSSALPKFLKELAGKWGIAGK